ncbi:MAG: tRNA (adenosine(37)-N6)-dimethylallyltransferase MiaA [Psychroflexus maritimus]
MRQKKLICVLGPTAIGKTSLGIALAKHFDTEIISADSRQFFKEMKIGTAVPSAEELQEVPHHFIQQISIKTPYSVGKFEKDALNKLEELFQKHDVVIAVGGSGLYVKALVDGLDQFPEVPEEIRLALNEVYKQKGISPLQEELKKVDATYAQKINLENPHRIIRALEVYRASGKKFSSFLGQAQSKRKFKSLKVGLTAPREVIYQRIEQRVDLMIEEGLIEEARALNNQQNLNALNTVGYKELFKYFSGEWTKEFAISEIKKNTRRFAKRQLTWFRNQEAIEWFAYNLPKEQIIKEIEQLIKSSK